MMEFFIKHIYKTHFKEPAHLLYYISEELLWLIKAREDKVILDAYLSAKSIKLLESL